MQRTLVHCLSALIGADRLHRICFHTNPFFAAMSLFIESVARLLRLTTPGLLKGNRFLPMAENPMLFDCVTLVRLSHSLGNAPVWQLLQENSSLMASIWKNECPFALNCCNWSPLPCARMVWQELQSLAWMVRASGLLWVPS